MLMTSTFGAANAKFRHYYRRVRAFLGKGFVQQRTKVVTVDDDDYCTNPIFIIGTHRSGTSLLRRIIDSHRNIACPPESYFLKHYTQILSDESTWNGLKGLGFDRDEAMDGFRKQASYFHEAYRQVKGKPRWADKTPQYVFHLDTLQTLFAPHAQFVFIMRHPLDVAFSIWDRGWDLGKSQTGNLLIDTCRYVLESGQTQLSFIERHADISAVVYYDQLVEHPERELNSLCHWLGEPFDPNMLRHSEEPHDFGTEDPIARGTKGFQGSYENWRAWSPPQVEQATSVLEMLIESMGYGLNHARVLNPLVRVAGGASAK